MLLPLVILLPRPPDTTNNESLNSNCCIKFNNMHDCYFSNVIKPLQYSQSLWFFMFATDTINNNHNPLIISEKFTSIVDCYDFFYIASQKLCFLTPSIMLFVLLCLTPTSLYLFLFDYSISCHSTHFLLLLFPPLPLLIIINRLLHFFPSILLYFLCLALVAAFVSFVVFPSTLGWLLISWHDSPISHQKSLLSLE